MVLIVSTCSEPLSEEEFVAPVLRIVRESGKAAVVRGMDEDFCSDVGKHQKIVITGTALKDFSYMEFIDKFSCIVESGKDVLGICSGAQILLTLLGGSLRRACLIGKKRLSIKSPDPVHGNEEYAYFLLSLAASELPPGSAVISEAESIPAFISSGRTKMCFFHPEVLNPGVISRFLGQS